MPFQRLKRDLPLDMAFLLSALCKEWDWNQGMLGLFWWHWRYQSICELGWILSSFWKTQLSVYHVGNFGAYGRCLRLRAEAVNPLWDSATGATPCVFFLLDKRTGLKWYTCLVVIGFLCLDTFKRNKKVALCHISSSFSSQSYCGWVLLSHIQSSFFVDLT